MTTGGKNCNGWGTDVQHKSRKSEEKMKLIEKQNIHQHQQRKIENLLQKMAKLEMKNTQLRAEVFITNNLLTESTCKVEMIEKKLLAEEKTMEDIQAKEVVLIKKSIEFLKKLSFFVERNGFHVGLFGSLVRRVAEPRSRTIEEHERFMTEFKKSDIDVCVFSCSNENLPNLGKIIKEMKEMGMIYDIDMTSYKKFVPNSFYSEIEHMKLSLKFKGEKFELDLFNRKPTSNFFGGRDFSCNLLQINGHDGSLGLPLEYQKTFGTLDTLLEIGTKTAHPLFPESSLVSNTHTAQKMSKLIHRQEKIIKNGYKVFPKLLDSTFSTSDEPCCVCFDKASDKINAEKNIPEHYIATCLCSEGRNLCSECVEHLLDTRDLRCPGCRQPLQVNFEQDEENKESESLIPEIVNLSISQSNDEELEIIPDAQFERNDINAFFGGALMPIYENNM